MLSHLKFKRNLGNCCYDNGVAMQIIDIFPLLSAFYAWQTREIHISQAQKC